MKVARKHIVAALEAPSKMMHFPKYGIRATPFTEPSGVFGWKIRVITDK
jgi:hypothetical protein